jgi:hypothetical protein
MVKSSTNQEKCYTHLSLASNSDFKQNLSQYIKKCLINYTLCTTK